MLEVAIGLLLLFLVASLIASAVVEAVGGFFHRRQKHLWDTLDLLLGNTSVSNEPEARRIVGELYKKPFITGLVRPTDRARFNPATDDPPTPPLRGQPKSKTRAREEDLTRRFYGPTHIDPRDFANALLAYIRPGGGLDRARADLDQLRSSVQPGATDIALADIDAVLDRLDAAADALDAGDLHTTITQIRAAGESIDVGSFTSALASIEASITRLSRGQPTTAELLGAIDALPHDLQEKLTSVVAGVGDSVADLRKGVEDWFDRHMATASEWYRRQTRWFLFLTGIVLAASMNIDAVHAATTFYRDDEARAAVVAVAEQVGQVTCPDDSDDADGATDETTPTTTTTVTADPDADREPAPATNLDLDCVRDSVGGSIALPIGWADTEHSVGAWVLRLLGWLLVAGAVTLGAPFWFDLLRRALDVRRGGDRE